jgi:hypothetical protein
VLLNLIGNDIPSSLYHVSKGDKVPDVRIMLRLTELAMSFKVKNETKQVIYIDQALSFLYATIL